MADTVVHEHVGQSDSSTSGSGIILAVVILLVLAFLVIFGIPFIRNVGTTQQAPQVNVPGQIDVNVKGAN